MNLSFELVTGILFFLVVFLLVIKRKLEMAYSKERVITIESTKHLGGRHKIAIINAENKRILVGITSSQISTLCELKPEQVAGIPRKNVNVTNLRDYS